MRARDIVMLNNPYTSAAHTQAKQQQPQDHIPEVQKMVSGPADALNLQITVDASALEFYFETMIPEVSISTRNAMAAAIRGFQPKQQRGMADCPSPTGLVDEPDIQTRLIACCVDEDNAEAFIDSGELDKMLDVVKDLLATQEQQLTERLRTNIVHLEEKLENQHLRPQVRSEMEDALYWLEDSLVGKDTTE